MAKTVVIVVCFTTTLFTGSFVGLKKFGILQEWLDKVNGSATKDASSSDESKGLVDIKKDTVLPEKQVRNKEDVSEKIWDINKNVDTFGLIKKDIDALGFQATSKKEIKKDVDIQEGKPSVSKAKDKNPTKAFLIEGFEVLEMSTGVKAWDKYVPRDRFNGRFAPTGKLLHGRPVFVQVGAEPFMGKVRHIAWFNGYWRYYSHYDDTSKAGTVEKCTFMVESDAKQPADISTDLQWSVHPSAIKYVKASGFLAASPSVTVRVRSVP